MVDGGKILIVLAFTALTSLLVDSADINEAYVALDDTGKFFIADGAPKGDWVAQAEFSNAVNETGWAYLSVTTNGQGHSDRYQAYAAGMVEGYITQEFIAMHWYNTMAGQFCEEPYTPECVKLRQFLQTNIDWMVGMIQNHTTDDYWHQIDLFLIQVDGLRDGYFNNSGSISYDIDPFGLFALQVTGDMEDIPAALGLPAIRKRPLGSGSCSALIKLLDGFQDLYTAQDTWTSYQDMLRILKKYDFNYLTMKTQASIPGRVITMSSYPGVLLSGDDYYLISSGLVSQETTIGNNNPSLNHFITPERVLEGIRTMVANRLAHNGSEWASMFSGYNSGTYNNQWMIINYNRFQPGFSPMDGLLTILEQIPGYIQYTDKTELLRTQKYWPSYNIPYFQTIFNESGCWKNVLKYGDWFTYDKTPRALIFKRDQPKVTDLTSMQKMMRYNNFKNDPLAACKCSPPYSGENGISSRSDLNPATGTYPFGALGHRSHGGTDMKLTNSDMMKNLEFIAIAGPTYDDLPPFQWSKADFEKTCPHRGHPDLFKFDPIHFNGTLSRTDIGDLSIKWFKKYVPDLLKFRPIHFNGTLSRTDIMERNIKWFGQ